MDQARLPSCLMWSKVSMACCSHLVTFYFKEKFCVSHASALQEVICEIFISKALQRPCRENYISGYIWHKSFIQTVQCSFFNQIIDYQSFYGTLLTFSYFLLQGKVMCFSKRRWDVSSDDPCWKSYISSSIWHESSIQMVKYSFPWRKNCLSKILEYKHYQ